MIEWIHLARRWILKLDKNTTQGPEESRLIGISSHSEREKGIHKVVEGLTCTGMVRRANEQIVGLGPLQEDSEKDKTCAT